MNKKINDKEKEIKFLNCSFKDKEQVKTLGAKWNGIEKKWYIPEGLDTTPFKKWLNNTLTKGDVGKEGIGGLYVDLVPSNTWNSNCRSMLSSGDWNIIKKEIYKNANYCCSICEGSGKEHPVEAHERWSFNIKTQTQKLEKIESLCPACHEATHFGLAEVKGHGDIALKRLMYVNKWSKPKALKHIEDAFKKWDDLNKINNWKLDISWLLNTIPISNESKLIIDDLLKGKVMRNKANI